MRNRTPVIIMIVALVAIVVVGGLIVANQRKSTTDTASTDETSRTQQNENSGSNSQPQDPGATGTDETKTSATIAIENFAFAPAKITIKAGTKVTWTNKDSTAHTATSDDGAPERFDSRLLQQGQSFSKTFTKPGTYKYRCTLHPDMQATIVVT